LNILEDGKNLLINRGGYRANMKRFPSENMTIIILSNLQQFNAIENSDKIADILLNLPPTRNNKVKKFVKTYEKNEKRNLKEYEGIFCSEEIDLKWKFYVEGNKLLFNLRNQFLNEIVLENNDFFLMNNLPLKGRFLRNNDKNIIGFDLLNNYNINFKKINKIC
jgi:hypothetical protein